MLRWALAVLLAGVAGPLPAQVLARPGWAGAGVAAEPWWRSAVIYRLDPLRFQDSGSTGRGDLRGVTQRLEYLQALGVDAILLANSAEAEESLPTGGEDLDQLIRSASEHRIRVLVAPPPALLRGDQEKVLQTVHDWLSAGVAGISLLKPVRTGKPGQPEIAPDPAVLQSIASLVLGFPGGRVLLAESSLQSSGSVAPGRAPGRPKVTAFSGTASGELIATASLPADHPSAPGLRESLGPLVGEKQIPGATALLRFGTVPGTGSQDAAVLAAALLGSRGAVLLDFGEEIGLDLYPPMSSGVSALPVMQWTPTNVQQPAPAPIERVRPNATRPGETEFGAYRPYVRPPPSGLVGAAPASPPVSVDGNIPPTLPDPDTLPGFTSGKLPGIPISGSKLNVAVEDREPGSLLNAYRQLIALHHGRATLRNGEETLLNRDAEKAVVWVRRAPAGSRTDPDILGAVNLGDKPITLSLDGDLAAAGLRTGRVRPLFVSAPQTLTGETTGALRLPPHSALLGEIAGVAARRPHGTHRPS